MKKILLFSVLFAMGFSSQSQEFYRLQKGQEFTLTIKDKNVKRPHFFRGVIKAIGISALSYKLNQSTNKLAGSKQNPSNAQVGVLPSVGLGLTLSYKDLTFKKSNNAEVGYRLYDAKHKLIGTYTKKLTKKQSEFKGVMTESGYLEYFINYPDKYSKNNITVKLKTSPPPENNFKGSIVKNMGLNSFGECLPEVIVCNNDEQVTEWDQDGYHYVETCIYTQTYNYSSKTCEPAPFPATCSTVSTSIPDYPWDTYDITYPDACTVCNVTTTHHTNGWPDDVVEDCYTDPGCGGEDPPPPPNPCDGLSTNRGIIASNTLRSPTYAGAANALASNVATDTVEKAFSFGTDTSGLMATTPLVTAPTGASVGINATYAGMNITGSMHTHTSAAYSAPSAGDIYMMAAAYAANPNYNTSFVFGADGGQYALQLTDPAALAAFVAAYPMATNFNPSIGDWMGGSPIRDAFRDVEFYLNPAQLINGAVAEGAFERAQAFVLRQFNMGIALLKADANGDFHEIHTVQNAAPSPSATTYTNVNCN
jgi:hypothetical protein